MELTTFITTPNNLEYWESFEWMADTMDVAPTAIWMDDRESYTMFSEDTYLETGTYGNNLKIDPENPFEVFPSHLGTRYTVYALNHYFNQLGGNAMFMDMSETLVLI